MSKECPKLLEFWSADEVAECMSVPEALYKKIWNEVVPQAEKDKAKDPAIKEVGYMEYPDQQWGFATKRYWKMFTEEEQQMLIDAVAKHEKEYA